MTQGQGIQDEESLDLMDLMDIPDLVDADGNVIAFDPDLIDPDLDDDLDDLPDLVQDDEMRILQQDLIDFYEKNKHLIEDLVKTEQGQIIIKSQFV